MRLWQLWGQMWCESVQGLTFTKLTQCWSMYGFKPWLDSILNINEINIKTIELAMQTSYIPWCMSISNFEKWRRRKIYQYCHLIHHQKSFLYLIMESTAEEEAADMIWVLSVSVRHKLFQFYKAFKTNFTSTNFIIFLHCHDLQFHFLLKFFLHLKSRSVFTNAPLAITQSNHVNM